MNKIFGITFAGILCGFLLAAAEKTPASGAEAEQEWNITADSIEMLMDNRLIELEGNVLVEDEQVRLSAKKMMIHLDENNKLKDIEAVGGVTVRKLDSSESATGDTGFYDAVKETVTLSGNCILLKDKNTLTGDKVVYNRKDNVISMTRATITLPARKGSGGASLGGFLGKDKDKEKDKEKDKDKEKSDGKKQEDKQGKEE